DTDCELVPNDWRVCHRADSLARRAALGEQRLRVDAARKALQVGRLGDEADGAPFRALTVECSLGTPEHFHTLEVIGIQARHGRYAGRHVDIVEVYSDSRPDPAAIHDALQIHTALPSRIGDLNSRYGKGEVVKVGDLTLMQLFVAHRDDTHRDIEQPLLASLR